MFNKGLLSVLTVTILIGLLSGCSTKETASQESIDLTFEAWTSEELTWPDWLEATEVEINEETKSGPTQVRRAFDLETAYENLSQMRYLVENTEDIDEYPYHNVWKNNLGAGLLKVGEYQLAYKYLSDIAYSEEGANYGLDKSDETVIASVTDKVQKFAHSRLLKAIANAGLSDEVMNRFNEYDYYAPGEVYSWQLNSAAWAMSLIGNDEEAFKLFEFGTVPENFVDKNTYQVSSNILAASSFAYTNGDYDKVLSFSDRFIAEGIDSTNPVFFGMEDYTTEKKAAYYKAHWTACYNLTEAFRALAAKAKDGEVVSFDNLKDGVYTSSNTSFMSTPIDVTVTVNAGKVSDIKVAQELPTDDRSGTAFESIPLKIIENQSLNVDVVSSATISSEAVKLGVANALLDAQN